MAAVGRRKSPVSAQCHTPLQVDFAVPVQVAAVHTHRKSVERLRELVSGVSQRAGHLLLAGTPIGAAVPAAFFRATAVFVPVGPHVPDGPRVVVDVELLLAEGKPAVHHGLQPQLSLQQLFRNDESRHGHVEGEVGGDDLVAPQDAAHHHRLGLDVDQLVAVALADEVEVVLVAGRRARHDHVDREAGFFHDVPDGVLAELHLQLQRTAGAEPALALKGQADALVGAVVHANQAGHLPAANFADGVELPDLLENGVEPRLFFRALGATFDYLQCALGPANMSFVDTLRQWDEAVTCADRQDWPEALSIFLSIQQPNSKICFDIGCLHLLNQDLDAAEKVGLEYTQSEALATFIHKVTDSPTNQRAFDCSIRKDEHLAVAFFQRGITFYKQKRQAA
ncbi:hypothetical protein CCH79_00016029 [Gambusia affinis]|uniref:Uncharacterized protein n=1 Tax=Gambusia affinis TaxID=33528 RepID=A0A315VPA1_GAMAF|nr:hypothetical protein CCH79_00016029 [Gambusia affinis]